MIKLPATIRALSNLHGIDYKDLLSVNPKTLKSRVQTYMLHLAPHTLSGVNLCAGAGNCKKICLHSAGNPAYMTSKQAARIKRSQVFNVFKEAFMVTLTAAICYRVAKHKGETLAIRLNGTSDVAWENVDFTIDSELVRWAKTRFGLTLPIGRRNIFEVFNHLSALGECLVVFYDYSKTKRNWQECQRLGYHLTASYDGPGSVANHSIVRDALKNGINIAAAFAIKKGKPLPAEVALLGQVFKVIDGDISDYRPADPSSSPVIVGLRFKLPHGLDWTPAQRAAFCIPPVAYRA